ncbi:MAG: ATP-dependent Clp protease adaptor ClpS, partial [Methylovulum sp.]|nr:ATP-dependent Clp protease adaptor ClpS [Methylovulum sp.]
MDDTTQHYEVVFYNDTTTPFEFVARLFKHLTGRPLYECEEMARRRYYLGKHSFGPYPAAVAAAICTEAQQAIADAGHRLMVESVNIAHPEQSAVMACSFCGKASTAVEKLFTGQNGAICDGCVVSNAAMLQELLPAAQLKYTFQLLDWHFGSGSPDKFVKTSRTYPGRVRADLQIAIDSLFSAKAIRAIGIKQEYGHEQIDLTSLWTNERNPRGLAPLSFEELDVGDAAPVQCQLNGLWLLEDNGDRYAAVLSRERDYAGGFTIFLEISGPQGERTAEITRKVFAQIEDTIKAAHSY